ncbi:DNA-binding protein RFX8 [Athene cunicularia]|uniref:DNA-binding protein RFX8 n=1 Tax=Athene cunicularia TaxID=194338 RepID=UPI000EF70408|nr:DNA-binding protein RFX8 [Athene cunicularia]
MAWCGPKLLFGHAARLVAWGKLKYDMIKLVCQSCQRVSDNFYLCEGGLVPKWLLYELCMGSCSPNDKYRVNAATFGKLIQSVFPGLRTRRLGRRGNIRYHYDGIAIKENSTFYAHYYSLLGNACSSGDAAGYKSNSQKERTNLDCSSSVIYLKIEQEEYQYSWPEFSTISLSEQELEMKYSYEMVQLANDYYRHCQDILHMVRKSELDKVEDCIMSFWRFLQPERIALMSLTDVCQLFKHYDRHLYKEIENILFHDFLEEVPVQHMNSIRLFSKNVELWLLNALEEFPLPLQTSKSQEVTLFIKRLGRKTDLCNIAKTVRAVLNSNSNVTVLRSELHSAIDQGYLDVSGNFFQTSLRNPEELQYDIELKCLYDLTCLLRPDIDIRVLLDCVSSNLQGFVIQPSRNKEEFRKLASDFQLRWNFLLSAVSKAMTLNGADGFGFWHLLNSLLIDFVGHVFLSYIEEEDESFWVTKQNEFPVPRVYEPSQLWVYIAEEQPQASAPQTALPALMQSQTHPGHTERENF